MQIQTQIQIPMVISGDMFMNVTSATSSEEGAVDLPGAKARSEAPDVLNRRKVVQ